MENIFHICYKHLWEDSLSEGIYTPTDFDTVGFIHCSSEGQLIQVANSFYMDEPDLIVLEIQTDQVEPEILWESAGGEKYPHIYGPLNTDSVSAVKHLKRNDKGFFAAVE